MWYNRDYILKAMDPFYHSRAFPTVSNSATMPISYFHKTHSATPPPFDKLAPNFSVQKIQL